MQSEAVKKLRKHRFSNRMDETLPLKEWGKRLRQLRKVHGYRNQEEMVEAMIKAGYDITQPAMSRAENGGLKLPQDIIFKFLHERHGVKHDDVFHVPVDWRARYYDLLEKIQGEPGEDRVAQLEGLVHQLQEELKRLKGN